MLWWRAVVAERPWNEKRGQDPVREAWGSDEGIEINTWMLTRQSEMPLSVFAPLALALPNRLLRHTWQVPTLWTIAL